MVYEIKTSFKENMNTKPTHKTKNSPKKTVDDFKITKADIRETFPNKKLRITDHMEKRINAFLDDPEMKESFRENFLTYRRVLSGDIKVKMDTYINAIKYCSYKIAGYSNDEAYRLSFPDRYLNMLNKQLPPREVASLISSYHKTKTVTAILEQSYIPIWILNQEYEQQAINKLVDLMNNGKSDYVKVTAANNLLNHLKRPEATKLDIGLEDNSVNILDDVQKAITDLAKVQSKVIKSGSMSVQDIAEKDIIEGEFIEEEQDA